MTCGTCDGLSAPNRRDVTQRAEGYCSQNADFAAWARGTGVICHDELTQVRIHELVNLLTAEGHLPDTETGYRKLRAADTIANAGMWLVAHMTYARQVKLDGTALAADAFKPNPQGHTGGSLNMVPAYVAYLALNALDGRTRSWMMGQGHCVAAIDAVNLLVGNMKPAHATRYDLSDEGLTRFVSDFYSCEVGPDGAQVSPLGSHVNANTAGGTQEGGYLGFAELHYVHAPLKGERLVAFLSDGAFEEQRGSDWAPRWWRTEDSGLVAPVMILNGRRIEQRTQIAQQGGERWLDHHLRLNTGSSRSVWTGGTRPASCGASTPSKPARARRKGWATVSQKRSRVSVFPVPAPTARTTCRCPEILRRMRRAARCSTTVPAACICRNRPCATRWWSWPRMSARTARKNGIIRWRHGGSNTRKSQLPQTMHWARGCHPWLRWIASSAPSSGQIPTCGQGWATRTNCAATGWTKRWTC
jgi:hypothetical protein